MSGLQPLETRPPEPTRLQLYLHSFTQSPEYQGLVARSRHHSQQRPPRPLRNLLLRYPYLYPYQVRARNPVEAEKLRQQALRLKRRKQQEFTQNLFDYAKHLLRQAEGHTAGLKVYTNPTLLTDRQLQDALRAFMGRAEGDRTYREVAAGFLSHVQTIPCYRDFKDELYEYLTATSGLEGYGRHKFNDRLYEQLCNTYPASDRAQVNDMLLLETCSRLLNFLVVENAQNPEHYTFIDLLTNLGPVPTTALLLKIVLLSQRVQPKLERRFSILFNHYGTEDVEEIRWFVDSLENLNVALGVHCSPGFDFSFLTRSPDF